MSGPWYIPPQAVRDYLAICGLVNSEDNFQRLQAELMDIAKEVVASGKEGVITDSGYLRYRTGRKYGRMTLIVSPVPQVEGDLPQLVGVARSR
jgi:hypothetical protein